ncbi:MAG: MFS transporter [Chloroflexi bacterium]|nr:MFS transporter [Chloroflexota bacterium]
MTSGYGYQRWLARRLFYGWAIVAATFVTGSFAAGVRTSFSVFYLVMVNEFGWSRAATAGAFSLGVIVSAISGLGTGFLIDRLGIRRVMPVTIAIIGASLLLAGSMSELWHLYAVYGLMAIGQSGLGYGPYVRLLSNWFRRLRGAAIGIGFAGNGIGTMIAVPLAQLAVEQVGWRSAYLVAGVAFSAVLLSLQAGVIRNRPQDMGLAPDGDPPSPETPAAPTGARSAARDAHGWGLRVWARSPALPFVLLSDCAMGASILVNVHQLAFLVDRGLDALVAAAIVGVAGLLVAVGQVVGGYLSDRLSRIRVLVAAAIVNFLGLAVLVTVGGPAEIWKVWISTVLYGLGWGVWISAASAFEAETFQGPDLTVILSISQLSFAVGAAGATWLAGYVRDVTGTYGVVLLLPGVTVLLAALFYLIAVAHLRRYPLLAPTRGSA